VRPVCCQVRLGQVGYRLAPDGKSSIMHVATSAWTSWIAVTHPFLVVPEPAEVQGLSTTAVTFSRPNAMS